MENKTHWKKAFKSDYLSSSDIDNEDLILTIKFVKFQECKTANGKKMCNVAHFSDVNIKPMILNVTNSKVLKKFSGNKTHLEDWTNLKVSIYVDKNVRFGNENVEGLRFRATRPVIKKKLTLLTNDKIQNAISFVKNGKTIADLKKLYSFNSDIEKQILEGVKNE